MLPGWEEGRSDFSNYYASAVLISNGESISDFYDNDWFSEKAKEIGEKDGAKFNPFPPVTAFLYLPLTFFNPLTAKRVWVVCNLVLIALLIFQLRQLTALKTIEVLFIVSLFFIPLASNIRLGQSYILFTVLIVSAINHLKQNKSILGGSILGIAASFKYLPIAYVFYSKSILNRKLIYGLGIGVFAMVLLPVLVNGFAPFLAFVKEFWQHMNGNISGQGQYSITFQSIDVLLANLFVYDSIDNAEVLLDIPQLKTTLKLSFALVIGYFSFYSIKTGKSKCRDLSAGIAIVGAALIIPASATYHLLFLIPAIILVISWMQRNNLNLAKQFSIIVLLFLICNLLPHHIPILENSPALNTLIHFPRLYGLIALFISLLLIQKRYLQQHV